MRGGGRGNGLDVAIIFVLILVLVLVLVFVSALLLRNELLYATENLQSVKHLHLHLIFLTRDSSILFTPIFYNITTLLLDIP